MSLVLSGLSEFWHEETAIGSQMFVSPLSVALLAPYHGFCWVKRSRSLLASTPTRDSPIRVSGSCCGVLEPVGWGVFSFCRSLHLLLPCSQTAGVSGVSPGW